MTKTKTLVLGDERLTLDDVVRVSQGGVKVSLSGSAKKKIDLAHAYLVSEVSKGHTLYGVNTGFGLLSNVKIDPDQIETLQVNLLRSHAVGIGPDLDERAVRAMLLLRAANLSLGHSGVRVEVVEGILNLLNHDLLPRVPEQGSVGASGDLAPLAHLALPLIGEGEVKAPDSTATARKWMDAGEALKKSGLKPLILGPKEGLALINGTQFMSALAVMALVESEWLSDLADGIASLTLEALRGTPAAFDPEIHRVRPHPGQIRAAARVRSFLVENGETSEISKSHLDCDRVQDPYSLRCIPQVHGASWEVLQFVRGVLEREINSVTDNPLVFPAAQKILSGGNFHGQILAMGMDFLAIAMAEIASISEQRIEKLINPAISELPAFLVREGGLNSGFMIVQVAAASLVSENKTLCHPASVDSIPTSADKEDHVSMGAWAARKAWRVVENTRRVLTMELLAGVQGIELLRPMKTTPTLEKLFAAVRKISKPYDHDRSLQPDFARVEKLIESDELRPYFSSAMNFTGSQT